MAENYYDILGVSEDADDETIREAYLRAIRYNHPDIRPDDPAVAERVRLLNAAKHTLNDAKRRKKYDRRLRKEREPTVASQGQAVPPREPPRPEATHKSSFDEFTDFGKRKATRVHADRQRTRGRNGSNLVTAVTVTLGAFAGICIAIVVLWAVFKKDPLGVIGKDSVPGHNELAKRQLQSTEELPKEQKLDPRKPKRGIEVVPQSQLRRSAVPSAPPSTVAPDGHPREAPLPESESLANSKVKDDEMQTNAYLINSIGMKLRFLSAGEFTMGSLSVDNALPHQVALSRPFYLGIYEVTQAEYQRVMGDNPSRFKGATNPVENISWEDAVEFCQRLSARPSEKAAGRVYRLPTEAEWEYACRAGTATEYSFGDDASQLGDYAWSKRNSEAKTHPVGQKSPNLWGLYDMYGNVSEYCQDWYGDYPRDAVTDPQGASLGSYRVRRGGGWNEVAGSAFRARVTPSSRNRSGFRISLTLPAKFEQAGVASAISVGSQPAESSAKRTSLNLSTTRLSVPNDEELKAARPAFREIFFERANNAKSLPLAERTEAFRTLAVEAFGIVPAESSAVQYLLLRGAVLWAIQSGNVDLTDKHIAEYIRRFDVDEWPLRLSATVTWNRLSNRFYQGEELKAARRRLLIRARSLAERAERELRFEIEKDFLELAVELSSDDRVQQTQLRKQLQAIDSKVERHTLMLELERTLEASADPKGALELGKYWCFEMQDWGKGLIFLAECADPSLRRIAKLEVAEPKGNMNAIEIGDGWWELSSNLRGLEQESVLRHAVASYQRGVNTLSGLERKRIEFRIRETLAAKNEEVLSRPVLENSIGMKFRLVPAGEFTMGSLSVNNVITHQVTPHQVALRRSFYLGIHEVTQADYQRVTGKNPSQFKGFTNPVENVSWYDAVEFCQRLSARPSEKAAGRVYRLPTEAEWEYACRAGTATKYSFGTVATATQFGSYAWFSGNAGKTTHPVGQKSPNPWGLYDMYGNVAEYCLDWHGGIPRALTNPQATSSSSFRVQRGGAWSQPSIKSGSGWRQTTGASKRLNTSGFRVYMYSPWE